MKRPNYLKKMRKQYEGKRMKLKRLGHPTVFEVDDGTTLIFDGERTEMEIYYTVKNPEDLEDEK